MQRFAKLSWPAGGSYKGEGHLDLIQIKLLDKSSKKGRGVGCLDGRVLTQTARGVGLSPTCTNLFLA